MTYSFHPEAEEEFFEAINYYEECEIGLGYEFAVETYSAIQRVSDFPKAWPILHEDIRRCLLNRFPCGVLFSVEPEQIHIVAVMHLHRKPNYWQDRR